MTGDWTGEIRKDVLHIFQEWSTELRDGVLENLGRYEAWLFTKTPLHMGED